MRSRCSAVLLATGILVTGLATADDSLPVFESPDQAKDFSLQGEYVGERVRGDQKQAMGAQVIALGDGKFDLVGYVGGLPGAGWSRGGEQHRKQGTRSGDTIEFTGKQKGVTAVLKGKTITVLRDGKTDFQMTKVARTSPTLGAAPPKGALVLFDGSNTDEWENGKLVDGKYLGATNVFSKKKLGDHRLHIEFRTPYMPKARGQGRGNSGVYVQGRYEVQVLDSFGLDGKNNECGGIYSISEPIVNMCLPPLSWQTYDMDFTAARYDESGKKTRNARVTIRHNGVVIHDDLELTHGTPGRHPEGPGPDSLFLQDHGNPVVFRNIWIVEK